ncbi:MAG: winged helix-turn-helix domain-containing protein [Asgard group archaeon]|nr:winged helix-turn-helix domain-containing protein [Asgard group archaeon]
MIKVPKETAQRFILERQGLVSNIPAKSVLEVVKRIHNIQIDTISVVARSHDLTVFSRLENYKEKGIWDFQKRKELFEYYSHSLCLIPIEEYPFYKWRMDDYHKRIKHTYWENWLTVNERVIDFVYKRIKKEGALSSKDFVVPDERKSKGWFDWKEEKKALEHLFYCGKLLISHRIGFQKYYDIPERVLPAGINNEPMEFNDTPDYLIETIFSSIGIGNFEEFRNYISSRIVKLLWKNKPNLITNFLEEKVNEGTLEEVKIDGIDQKQFILAKECNNLNKISVNNSSFAKLINPFDNIARDRKLLLKLWNFDYKLEAYTPPPQRVFGYYLMPILDGHKFVGRLEPKAHRKEGILEIKSIYYEDWFKPNNDFYDRLIIGLEKFASFHNCNKISLNDSINKKIKSTIQSSATSDFFN